MAIKKNNDFDLFEKHAEDEYLFNKRKKNDSKKNDENLIKENTIKVEKKEVVNLDDEFIESQQTLNSTKNSHFYKLAFATSTILILLVLIFLSFSKNESIIVEEENITPLIEIEDNPTSDELTVRPELLQLQSLYNNNEVVGTLQFSGVEEIFVIPQGDNNEFYKRHNLFRESDDLGSIYLDFNSYFDDKNFIIFGNCNENNHLSFIQNYSDTEYFNENNIIYTKDELYDYTWEIFSYYETNLDELNIIQTEFNDLQSFYVNAITYLTKSIHDVYDDSYISEDDYILTINGVSDINNKNYFIHAKLIDKQDF